MQKKSQRLQKNLEIERVKKNGKILNSRFFKIKYVKGAKTRSRVTVIVSKTSAKLSVDRNRLKRRIRALISPWLVKKPPVDMIIYINSATKTAKTPEIKNAFNKLLKNILK